MLKLVKQLSVILISTLSFGVIANAEANNDRSDKQVYAQVGSGWWLVYASWSATAGVFLSDNVAIEAKAQGTTYETRGSWSAKCARTKVFFHDDLYTTIGAQVNEDVVIVSNGRFIDTPWGPQKDYDHQRATSIGPQLGFGMQNHIGPSVLGIEFISLYYAVYYRMDGTDSEAEAKRHIRTTSDGPLNWSLSLPKFSVGITF